MKFTWSWICDHLETKFTISEICKILPMIGLEVEELYNPIEELSSFIVVEITKTFNHPNADRLKLCHVNTGSEVIQVVCGASNARVGLKTVLAPVNTWIPEKKIFIKEGKIRGEKSEGMLCSPLELGVSDDENGIIELSEISKIGENFDKVASRLNFPKLDPVIEIAITPNRGDCLGVRGIARDIAAAGFGKLKDLDFSPEEGSFKSPIRWVIHDEVTELVPSISGRYFKNLKNTESPKWIKERLIAIGQRPISAIVDITNYIMIDLGRPLHAFDADKIDGSELFIRNAKCGEKILALNEKTYDCDEKMIVIGDKEGPDDIAGIMGGERTSITSNTKNMFLEIAIFSPNSVASTGRKLNINSDARYRFERGLDFESPEITSGYIARFFKTICGGEFSQSILIKNTKKNEETINFSPDFTKQLTGVDCNINKQYEILTKLGFKIDKKEQKEWKVKIPSWRNDIEGKSDLVEEIIRIYGYDKLETKSLENSNKISIPSYSQKQKKPLFLRRFLSNSGFYEVVTFSFINDEFAKYFGGGSTNMQIYNPISSELNCMRPSLIPNLLEVTLKNKKRGEKNIKIFEVGPVFLDTSPDGQRISCAALRIGKKEDKNWQDEGKDNNVYDIKSDLFSCLEVLGLQTNNLQISSDFDNWYHPGRAGKIILGKFNLGTFGEIHPKVLEYFNINERVFCFEFLLEDLPPHKNKGVTKKYINLSPFQPVQRDFSFVVPKDLEAQKLIHSISKSVKDIINIDIFDIYQGQEINYDKKSIAISVTLQPKNTTFSEQELNNISKQIIANAEKYCEAKLRN